MEHESVALDRVGEKVILGSFQIFFVHIFSIDRFSIMEML